MRNETIATYSYNELSDTAKENARLDYRDRFLPREVHGACAAVLERAEKVGVLLGFEFERRMEGEQKVDRPAFWFHGFDGPTCGAAFDANWERDKVDYIAVFKQFGEDEKLCNIAKDMRDAPNGSNALASSPRGGPTLDVDVMADGKCGVDEAIDIERAIREFAAWIYTQLKAAYDAVSSDEAVAASIEARGTHFTVTGGTLA